MKPLSENLVHPFPHITLDNQLEAGENIDACTHTTAPSGEGMMQTTNTAITFDAATGTYRLHRDWRDDESITTAVVMGVAAITNTPPTELGPVFETIDSDALNRLFHSSTCGSSRDAGSISFHLHGCAVRVYATGEIEITPDGDDTVTTTIP